MDLDVRETILLNLNLMKIFIYIYIKDMPKIFRRSAQDMFWIFPRYDTGMSNIYESYVQNLQRFVSDRLKMCCR